MRIPLLVFTVLAAGFHLFFLGLAAFKTVWYDEAVPGLMALQILRGDFPVFYWGSPYLGSLESLVAALLFTLFGASTRVLRFSPLLFFAIYGIFLFKLGQRVLKRPFPGYVALFLAVPPLVLNEYSVSPVGGYIHTVALGTVLLYLTSRLLEDDGHENRTLLYGLFGLIAGVGFWTFMMIVPYIFACLLCLLLRERRSFFGPRTALAAVAFFVGSLPFWVWNARHGFLTFAMKAGVVHSSTLKGHLANFYGLLMMIMGSGADWFRGDFEEVGSWLVVATLLFAGLVLAINARKAWSWLLEGLRRPGTLHLVAACLAASVGAYVFSVHGRIGITRYLLPLYSSLPLLLAHLFGVLSARSRLWHLLFVPLLLSLTLPANAAFIAYNRAQPQRDDMAALLRFLDGAGITHAYAHFTVAQPISFESRERVICTDFQGFRNLDYLHRVDAAPAAAVAIVTHADLRTPAPAGMEEQIRALTHSYRKETIGKYTVFHGFDLPNYAYLDRTPLASKVAASSNAASAALMTDGNVSTVWESADAGAAGPHEIVVELERETVLSKVSVLWGQESLALDGGVAVEVSPDGERWLEVQRVRRVYWPFQAFRGRPKLIENRVTELLFEPARCRFVRLREAEKGKAEWAIAELTLAERAGTIPSLSPEQAAAALRAIGTSFVMAEPWVLTELRAAGGALRTISPLHDEYGRAVGRREERIPDANAQTAFVVPAHDRGRTAGLLAAAGFSLEETRIADLALIKALPPRGTGRRPVAVDVRAWEESSRTPSPDAGGTASRAWTSRGDFGEVVALDGFVQPEVPSAGLRSYAVAFSEDGVHWTSPRAQAVEELLWTDYALLKAWLPEAATFAFDAPTRARYVEVRWLGGDPERPRFRFFRWDRAGGGTRRGVAG